MEPHVVNSLNSTTTIKTQETRKRYEITDEAKTARHFIVEDFQEMAELLRMPLPQTKLSIMLNIKTEQQISKMLKIEKEVYKSDTLKFYKNFTYSQIEEDTLNENKQMNESRLRKANKLLKKEFHKYKTNVVKAHLTWRKDIEETHNKNEQRTPHNQRLFEELRLKIDMSRIERKTAIHLEDATAQMFPTPRNLTDAIFERPEVKKITENLSALLDTVNARTDRDFTDDITQSIFKREETQTKLAEVAEMLHGYFEAANQTKQTMKAAEETAKSYHLTSVLDLVTTTFKNNTQHIAKTVMIGIIDAITTIINIGTIIHAQETSTKLVASLNIVSTAIKYLSNSLFEKFKNVLERFMERITKPKAEGKDDRRQIEENPLQYVFSMLGHVITGNNSKMEKLSKVCVNLDNIITRGGHLIEWIIKAIEAAKDYIELNVLKRNIHGLFEKTHQDMQDFIAKAEEINEIITNYETTSKLTTEEQMKASDRKVLALKIHSAYMLGKKIDKDLVGSPMIKVVNYFKEQLKAITALHQAYIGSSLGYMTRHEPFHICFVGAPGVGKTNTFKQMYKDFEACLGRKHTNIDREVYINNPTDDYHDTYRGQEIFVFDDMFQFRSAELLAAENALLNQLKGRQPYKFNCAGLQAKENTYFSSKYIFSTCNAHITTSTVGEANLLDANSATRRVDLEIAFVPDPEFRGPVTSNGFYPWAKKEVTGGIFEQTRHCAYIVKDLNGMNQSFRYAELIPFLAKRIRDHELTQEKLDTMDSNESTFQPIEDLVKAQSGLINWLWPAKKKITKKEFKRFITLADEPESDSEGEFDDVPQYEEFHVPEGLGYITTITDVAMLCPIHKCTGGDACRLRRTCQAHKNILPKFHNSCLCDLGKDAHDFTFAGFAKSYKAYHQKLKSSLVKLESKLEAITNKYSVATIIVAGLTTVIVAVGMYKVFQQITKKEPAVETADYTTDEDEEEAESCNLKAKKARRGVKLESTNLKARRMRRGVKLEGDTLEELNWTKFFTELEKIHVNERPYFIAAAVEKKRQMELKQNLIQRSEADTPKERKDIVGRKTYVNKNGNQTLDVKTEAIIDESAETVQRMLKPALVRVANRIGMVANGIMIKNHILLCNAHMIGENDSFAVGASMVSEKLCALTSLADVPHYRNEGADFLLIDLSKKVQCSQFRDITKHFIKEEDLLKEPIRGNLLVLERAKDNPFKRDANTSVIIKYSQNVDIQSTPLTISTTDSTFIAPRYTAYSLISEQGDCGSPFVTHNTSFKRKIIGIHMAGNSHGTGFCNILTQERLQEGLKTFNNSESFIYPEVDKFIEHEFSIAKETDASKIEIVGSLNVPHTIRSPSKTDLRETILFEQVFPTNKMPSAM